MTKNPSSLTEKDRQLFSRLRERASAFPFLILLVFGGILIGILMYARSVTEWVDHTDQVIGQAVRCEQLIVDAETRIRGYLLTHEGIFLQPYANAKKN